MNPEELDEQFKELEGDKQVQAAAAGTPPAAAKRKRITTAQVRKELNQLRKDIEEGFLEWVGQLDSRVDKLEAKNAQTPIMEPPMLEARLNAMEKGIAILQGNQSELMKAYTEQQQTIDTVTGSVNTIHDAVIELAEQPAATELEFAKPPIAIPVAGAETADIAAVASVCLTMNDVLLITRALKDSPQLTDLERVEILNIACNSAGVECTHGLEVRAGALLGAV